MRFLENGPSIPDDLLLARDLGKVLFFCGAGVSRAFAQLPDFSSLARDVLEQLGSANDSPARRLFNAATEAQKATGVNGLVAFDRIFGLLEREFEAFDVRQAVARTLRPRQRGSLDAHRILLDLSRTRGGMVRLVTTNFDRLFEDCMPDLVSSNPPRLPDPSRQNDFHGVVHLHGVVNPDYQGARDGEFVLSSADFGHAYLSDGWATRYIRTLLQHYRIIFVGYSADDPPVQYLLEALNRFGPPPHALYAFQSGDKEQAAQQWSHKGVSPITYDSRDGHAPLWDTLAEWARRARDVDDWYDGIINCASLGPASMKRHERGIVAHLAANETGAKRIAVHPNALPADWLFVFDRHTRYGPVPRWYDDQVEKFDPFEAFAIDSDPLPEPVDADEFHARRAIPDVWDAMRTTPEDTCKLSPASVASFHARADASALPPRLAAIGQWLVKISNQPAALWWTAKQSPLHPTIQSSIERSLRNEPTRYPPEIRRGWHFLFRSWKHPAGNADIERFQIEQDAKTDGWTVDNVHRAVSLYQPHLTVEAADRSSPPRAAEDFKLGDLLRISVEYPSLHQPIEVPDEVLVDVVKMFVRNLGDAFRLEGEIGQGSAVYLDSLNVDDDTDLSSGLRSQLITLTRLMTRFAKFDESRARAEVARWDADDPSFVRMRLWAAGQSALTSPHEAATIILSVDDEVFWSDSAQRDILFTLRSRWSELPLHAVKAIETRLCAGIFPYGTDRDDFEAFAASYRLDRLRWLALQGVTFSAECVIASDQLQSIATGWTEERARDAAQAQSGVRSIGTDHSSDALDELPLADVLEKAKEVEGYSFRDAVIRQPFSGLAKRRPGRALSAISNAARRGVFDVSAWRALLQADAVLSHRLIRAIAFRLARLRAELLIQIVTPASDWLCNNFILLCADRSLALDSLWNAILTALRTAPDLSRKPSKRSWFEYGINRPLGRMTECWFRHPEAQHTSPELGLPDEWILRLAAMLDMPAGYRQQAIAVAAGQLNWLFHVAKQWTSDKLLGFLSEASGEDGNSAFWSGYLRSGRPPQPPLFRQLKEHMIVRAAKQTTPREEMRRLGDFLLVIWAHSDRSRDPCEEISNTELRDVLIHANNELRVSMLTTFKHNAQVAESPFSRKAQAFLEQVWPLQFALRSPELSQALVGLLISLPDQFATLSRIALRRLVRLNANSTVLYDTAVTERLVNTCPRGLLELLLVILDKDPANWPYSSAEVLRLLGKQPETRDDSRLAAMIRQAQRGSV
jgi:hypothetical protein